MRLVHRSLEPRCRDSLIGLNIMAGNASGHRSVPHTADLRIEAPTCITSSARALQTRRRRVTGDRDDDLLVAALEEVIYLLETTGEAPVDVNLSQPTEVST